MEGGIWAFYYLQSEDGEDRSHPNAYRLPGISPGADVTLADVLKSFPLRNPSAFHFRFRLNSSKGNTFYWLDVTQPTQKVPVAGGRVIIKLLRLERPQKPVSAQPSSANSDFLSAMDPLAARAAPAAQTSPSKSVQRDPPKFDDDNGQTVGPVTMAEMQAHSKSTSDGSNVYNPNLVDKSTKSEDVRRAMEERERQVQRDVEKARDDLRKREEATRNMTAMKESANTVLGPKLKGWAEDNGRVKNIRTLLSTMHQVMWTDSKWSEVNMGKLIQPNDVKKHYRKAMIVVHPDKSGGRNAEQLLIAERVFAALNTAWDDFQKANPC
ncbi:hypothetical protein JM18_006307 [Phytophthora kernoviae]|uniref:J domain-containing protein n=1 Tax=Phytophthora kernoviae TaxID=325452 RepID=A0A921V6U4_9STRA|nr:hypothetical protein JM18_006307 [Phytophthora kernoviae]